MIVLRLLITNPDGSTYVSAITRHEDNDRDPDTLVMSFSDLVNPRLVSTDNDGLDASYAARHLGDLMKHRLVAQDATVEITSREVVD